MGDACAPNPARAMVAQARMEVVFAMFGNSFISGKRQSLAVTLTGIRVFSPITPWNQGGACIILADQRHHSGRWRYESICFLYRARTFFRVLRAIASGRTSR